MNTRMKDAYEYGDWYMDGSLYVVVVGGQPSDNVEIGIGDTPAEAVESLESTPIQCVGKRYINEALNWACDAGWISNEELDETENPEQDDNEESDEPQEDDE